MLHKYYCLFPTEGKCKYLLLMYWMIRECKLHKMMLYKYTCIIKKVNLCMGNVL